jgi:FdhD protein
MDSTRKYKVLRCEDNACNEFDDVVAEEKRLRISINGKELLGIYCTPTMIRELVVGLLMTEEIADVICSDRMSINYGDEILVDAPVEGKVKTEGASITSGCAGGIAFRKKQTSLAKEDEFSVSAKSIRELFERFNKLSGLHNATGCVHSAALSDGKDIICFAEDIGRHNALDKVIGQAILENIGFKGKLMLASGRLSSEMAGKCTKWGIPIVASRTAPTALSIEIADLGGVTVVGFVRGKRLNVYTHPERIT